MDSGEHEGVSNSPNVNRITRIQGGAENRCIVHLSSGSSFFVTFDDMLELELTVGVELSEPNVCELEFRQESLKARDKALELIAMRDHSEFQLKRKLLSRGFTRESVDSACESCVDLGYLDDLTFAKRWIESRVARRNEGVLRLQAGLAKAGVSRTDARAAIEETLSDFYEEEAFQREVEILESRGESSTPRIVRRLSSRGFSSSRIQSYLERRRTFDD